MSEQLPEFVYLCPKCLVGQEAEGHCPIDGTELVECEPGAGDDPRRRPLIDKEGHVITRAPRWWLKFTVKEFMGFVEKKRKG